MKPAQRMDGVDMSGIRKMFEMAGDDAVHLGLGEPDFEPPEVAVEAMEKALRSGKNSYGPSSGVPRLREALAAREAARAPGVTADHVVVTAGSTAALYAAFQGFISPGDEVLIPDPGFVLYAPHTRLAGGRPVPYALEPARGFLPDPDALAEAVTADTRAVVVNSPGNPTGGALDEATARAVVDLAEDHDLLVFTDEAYDSIIYEGPHVSLLGRLDDVIYFNTFSKTYAMTGWRVGYAVARPELAATVQRVAYHMYACPPTPPQWGALAALEASQDFVRSMVDTFRKRRDYVVERLNAIPGFHIAPPRGAFYALPAYDFDIKSTDLSMRLLEAGLVTSPGTAFGAAGEGHIRLSYAADMDTLGRGLDILEAATADLS